MHASTSASIQSAMEAVLEEPAMPLFLIFSNELDSYAMPNNFSIVIYERNLINPRHNRQESSCR